MTTDRLTERADGWQVTANGLTVTQCRFDYALSLVLADELVGFIVRIEGVFTLSVGGTEQRLNPEHRPPECSAALALLDTPVKGVFAARDGHLRLTFGDAASVEVAPGVEYEAWNLSGPDGVRLVGTPNGGLSVWTGTD